MSEEQPGLYVQKGSRKRSLVLVPESAVWDQLQAFHVARHLAHSKQVTELFVAATEGPKPPEDAFV